MKVLLSSLFSFLVLPTKGFLTDDSSESCLPECQCSSQSIDCRDGNLSAVPSDQLLTITLPLKYLNLRRNRISRLSNNAFNGVFSPGSYLDLSENPIQIIEEHAFDGCENLERLVLINTGLSQLPTAFKTFKNLNFLSLEKNRLSHLDENVMSSLGFSLTGLTLNNNKFQKWQEGIRYLQLLQHLYTENNPIHSIPNGSFHTFRHSLENLYLGNTALGCLPDAMRELTTLAYLSISNNPLGDLGFPEGIFESMKDTLISIDMENVSITTIPNAIKNLRKLEKLNLGNNAILFISERDLDKLTNLKTLLLNACGLRRIPSVVTMLPSLSYIVLDDNPIVTVETRDLFGMTNLADLHMDNTSLRYVSSAAFHATPNLQQITMRNNLLQEIPVALRAIVLDNFLFGFSGIYKFENNPIQCSCEMKWIKEWIGRRATVTSVPLKGNCVNYMMSIENFILTELAAC